MGSPQITGCHSTPMLVTSNAYFSHWNPLVSLAHYGHREVQKIHSLIPTLDRNKMFIHNRRGDVGVHRKPIRQYVANPEHGTDEARAKTHHFIEI